MLLEKQAMALNAWAVSTTQPGAAQMVIEWQEGKRSESTGQH